MRVDQARVVRALFGMGLVAVSSGPAAVASATREAGAPPPATLHVQLTVAPQLPRASRAELVAEATAVWHRAGLHLVWIAVSDGSVPPGRLLRVLVIQRRPPVPESPEKYVLGELVSFGRPGALAIASIDRAEALVASSRRPDLIPASLHDNRVGLVLGRAIAHEIGHYLLNTSTHARTGLMRATFETRELLDRRSGTFDLDAAATAWLQDRIDRGMPIGPATETWTGEDDEGD